MTYDPTVPSRREPSGSGSATSYIRSSFDEPPVPLTLTLAGSIGIPVPHSGTPPTRELMLDPVTLQPRPSPHMHPRPNISDAIPPRDSTLLNHTSPVFGVVSLSPSAITSTLPLTTGDCAISDGSLMTNEDQVSPPMSEHSIGSDASDESDSSPTPSPWIWPIAEAVSSRQPVLVPSLPTDVAETLSRRAWGDIPRQAVVVPIWAYEGDSSNSLLPQAVLVLGLNPRRPYDKAYEEWVDLLRISLGGSLAAVLSWEAEKQRAECVWLSFCW
jgi:hypothetical protein